MNHLCDSFPELEIMSFVLSTEISCLNLRDWSEDWELETPKKLIDLLIDNRPELPAR